MQKRRIWKVREIVALLLLYVSFVRDGSVTGRAHIVDCGSVVRLIKGCILMKRGSVTPSKSEQRTVSADIWWPLATSNQGPLLSKKSPSFWETITKRPPCASDVSSRSNLKMPILVKIAGFLCVTTSTFADFDIYISSSSAEFLPNLLPLRLGSGVASTCEWSMRRIHSTNVLRHSGAYFSRKWILKNGRLFRSW